MDKIDLRTGVAMASAMLLTGCASHMVTVTNSTYSFKAETINHYGRNTGVVAGVGYGLHKTQGDSERDKLEQSLKYAAIAGTAGAVVDEFLPENKEYKMHIKYYCEKDDHSIKRFSKKLDNGIFLQGDTLVLDTFLGIPYSVAGDIKPSPERTEVYEYLKHLQTQKNIEASSKSYRFKGPTNNTKPEIKTTSSSSGDETVRNLKVLFD